MPDDKKIEALRNSIKSWEAWIEAAQAEVDFLKMLLEKEERKT